MLKFERRGRRQDDDSGAWGFVFIYGTAHVCQKQNKELALRLKRKWWKLLGVGNDNLEPFHCHSGSCHLWERLAVIKSWFVLCAVHCGVRFITRLIQAIDGAWAFLPGLNCQAHKRCFIRGDRWCLLASHNWWPQSFKVFCASAGFLSCLIILRESFKKQQMPFLNEI